jgi:RNA methyltransferase, TrmH family
LKPLSWYKNLSDARGRRESGRFLVEGRRAIEQIKIVAPESVEEILVTDKLSDEFKNYSCPVRVLTERQFKTVCTSKTPQGAAAVVKIPEKSYSDELPSQTGNRILLLEGVQDPGNVGTLVRTAAAFDFGGVVLSGSCADPFSPKAVQASAGAVMSVWVRRTACYIDCAEGLKRRGFLLIAADVRGDRMLKEETGSHYVIMLGNEGAGLSNKLLTLANRKVRIPMNNRNVESLNVAVSGALLMFYYSSCVSQD